jgi:ElaB/YqjD/DUF883 family membrane-anchored ribosome-binding protein
MAPPAAIGPDYTKALDRLGNGIAERFAFPGVFFDDLSRCHIDLRGEAVMAEKQETGERPGGDGSGFGFGQATEAIEKLRAVVEQASRSIRDLTQASEQWARETQERATGMAKELRVQGERAVGTVTQQVEHNPLTSLAVAFAAGFLVASLVRR